MRDKSALEHEVVEAVLYAMREGCLFDVKQPRWSKDTDKMIVKLKRCGAMRYLHNKVAELTREAK